LTLLENVSQIGGGKTIHDEATPDCFIAEVRKRIALIRNC
jgi:hypothetical protein